MVKIPVNFDGKKFMEKYKLTNDDFVDRLGFLDVPSLPDLTEKDLEDCVTDPKDIFVVTVDLFVDAYLAEKKGDPTKMAELLLKFEQSKGDVIEIPDSPVEEEPIDPIDGLQL